MNRPIKFRGKRANGEFVYGSYCREVYCDIGTLHVIIDKHGEEFNVYSESVAQLVGFDCDGNEVYEGDVFVIPCGTEIAARFFDNIIPGCKLKEARS